MGIIGLILGIVSVIIGAFTSLKWLAIVIAIISIIISGVNIFIRLKNSEKYILSIIGIIIAFLAVVMNAIFIGIGSNSYDLNENGEKLYKIGSIYNGDNLNIKLLSVDTNYNKVSDYLVTPGYNILKVDFEIENRGETNRLFTDGDFKCYSNESECQSFSISSDNMVDITPGAKENVSFYYEIPEDSSSIKLVYDTGDISNGNVSFVVKK